MYLKPSKLRTSRFAPFALLAVACLISARASYAAEGVDTLKTGKTSNNDNSPRYTKKANGHPVKTAKHRVSEGKALDLVAALPEVKKWQAEVEKASKTRKVSAHIAMDRKEGHEYVVQVFEDVPDDDESSHSATFNWYHVNDLTGKVRKEF